MPPVIGQAGWHRTHPYKRQYARSSERSAIQPTKLFGKQSSQEHLQGLDNEAATTGGDKLCALVGLELWSISPSGTIELIFCCAAAAGLGTSDTVD